MPATAPPVERELKVLVESFSRVVTVPPVAGIVVEAMRSVLLLISRAPLELRKTLPPIVPALSSVVPRKPAAPTVPPMVAPARLTIVAAPPSVSEMFVEVNVLVSVRAPPVPVVTVLELSDLKPVVMDLPLSIRALPRIRPALSNVAEASPLTIALPKTSPVVETVASAAPPASDPVELPLLSKEPFD